LPNQFTKSSEFPDLYNWGREMNYQEGKKIEEALNCLKRAREEMTPNNKGTESLIMLAEKYLKDLLT